MIDTLFKLKSIMNQEKQWHEMESIWFFKDTNQCQVISAL